MTGNEDLVRWGGSYELEHAVRRQAQLRGVGLTQNMLPLPGTIMCQAQLECQAELVLKVSLTAETDEGQE